MKIFFKSNFLRNSTPTPYKILIQLTNDCNSKCKSCFIWKINIDNPELRKQELSPSQYGDFLRTYGVSLYWISLSGGEISLYKNLDELLQIIADNCPNLCILTFTTNGLLPDYILKISQKIKCILPHCDFFVTVSMDGDRALHDQLRGVDGNYELALKTKQLLNSNKINAQFGTTINNDNSTYFQSLENDYELPYKAVSIVHSDGIYNRHVSMKDVQITKALLKINYLYKVRTFGEIIEFLYLKIAVSFLKNDRQKMLIPCEVINTSLHVTPYGDVLPCMYLPPIGNIKNENIKDILESNKTKNALEKIRSENCPKCWMNCYAPHSMMRHPLRTLKEALWK